MAGTPLELGGKTLFFSAEIAQSSLRLFALPEDLLKLVERGESLEIKAGTEDEAVLCSPTETFQLQFVETSNMALLVPFGATLRHPASRDVLDGLEEVVGDSEAVAVANVGGVYELRRTAPRLGRLAELLRRAPFRGEDAEADIEAAHADAIRALDAEDDALTAAAVAAAAEPPPHTPTKPRRRRHDRSGTVAADDDDNGPEGGDDATDDQGRAVAVVVASTQDAFAATADDLAPFRATDEGEDDLPAAVAAAHARRSVLARRHRTVADCTTPLEEAAALRTQNRFTLEELERVVQSSRLELRRALASLGAVSIGPFWRLLDEGFEHALLDRLLELILSQQWPPTRVPGRECVVLLGDVAPPTVVVHLLHRLGAPLSDDPDGDWALRWRAVARFRGHELLRTIRNTATVGRRPAGTSGAGLSALEALLESSSDAASAGSFRVRDFLATWRSALVPLGALPEPRALSPEDVAALNAVRAAQAEAGVLASGARLDSAEFDWTRVELGLALLRGLALETVARGEPVVLYFPEHELPFDGPGRFRALFAQRERWKMEDIEPFLLYVVIEQARVVLVGSVFAAADPVSPPRLSSRSPILGPGQALGDLLLQHTRNTLLPDGSREYSCR